jgi:hypothetical protein
MDPATAQLYDMRGRAITQHFFDELEKIAARNPFDVIKRTLKLRGERKATEAALGAGDYLSKGTPWLSKAHIGVRVPGTYGAGTKEYRMAQAARVREATAKAKDKAILDARTQQAFQTGTHAPQAAERKAALEYIQEARGAKKRLAQPDRGSVRQRFHSFMGTGAQQPAGPMLSGRAKAGLAAGGLALGAGGGLYAYNKMNQGQGGYGGGY